GARPPSGALINAGLDFDTRQCYGRVKKRESSFIMALMRTVAQALGSSRPPPSPHGRSRVRKSTRDKARSGQLRTARVIVNNKENTMAEEKEFDNFRSLVNSLLTSDGARDRSENNAAAEAQVGAGHWRSGVATEET